MFTRLPNRDGISTTPGLLFGAAVATAPARRFSRKNSLTSSDVSWHDAAMSTSDVTVDFDCTPWARSLAPLVPQHGLKQYWISLVALSRKLFGTLKHFFLESMRCAVATKNQYPCMAALVLVIVTTGSSNAAEPTPTCYPSATPVATVDWPSSDPNILLTTDFYVNRIAPQPGPVLVFRGAGQRCGVERSLQYIWPPDAMYHLVVQDIRENDNSLFEFDQDDGHDLLELINAQPWSRGGNLAMEGWSNAGIVDYLAAVGASVSLRGIAPHFATGDLLNYCYFNGGVLHRGVANPDGTSWADYVSLPIWNNYLITDNQAAATHVAGLHVGGGSTYSVKERLTRSHGCKMPVIPAGETSRRS